MRISGREIECLAYFKKTPRIRPPGFTKPREAARIPGGVSPRLSFFNLVQYDNRSRNLGWQSRARWSPQPGNDVFLVIHQGWVHEPGDRRFKAEDRKVSAKIQYSIRF